MNIKKRIEELTAEGKTAQEIAVIITGEFKSASIDEVSDLIAEAARAKMVADSVTLKLAQRQEAEKTEKQIEKLIDMRVDEKLKSINVNPFGSLGDKDEYKYFNRHTGKMETKKKSVARTKFYQLLTADSSDRRSAISREIDQDNRNKWVEIENEKTEEFGRKTPGVSDVTTRGGYAVPDEVSQMIHQLIYSESVMYPLFSKKSIIANNQIVPVISKKSIIANNQIVPVIHGMTVADIADQSTAATETNYTMENPTIPMKRAGGWTTLSNEIMDQHPDIVDAITAAIGSAWAEFLDYRLAVGNVTGASQLVDGIVFDANTSAPTAVAWTDFTLSTLATMVRTLSAKASTKTSAFIGNRVVRDKIGALENSAGALLFPGYLDGREMAPFGIPFKCNPQITSVLNIGGDNNTGGTDDVIILADFNHCFAGISESFRLESSPHVSFTSFLETFRTVARYGCKVISATGTAGIVAIAQEMTN